jgi:DNA-binding response OmpR family regulator
VWGQGLLIDDNALKVAISKLRTKLANTGYTITASRGEGYYLERE